MSDLTDAVANATGRNSHETAPKTSFPWHSSALLATTLLLVTSVAGVVAPGLEEHRAVIQLKAAGANIRIGNAYPSGKDGFQDMCQFVLANLTGRNEFKRGLRIVELTEKVPAADLALTKSLRDVQSITLRGPQWEDSHLTWIAESLPRNTELILDRTNVSGAGLEALKGSKVEYLYITGRGDSGRMPDLLSGVKSIQALKLLTVKGMQLTDESVKPLANHPSLETVWLLNGKFTEEGIAPILSMKRLKILNLHDSEISQDALQALAAHKVDGTLGLGRSNITDDDLATLKTGFQWTWVSLIATDVTAAGIRSLPKVPRKLSIQDTGIRVTVEFLDAIEALGCQELVVHYSQCDPAALRRGGRLPKVVEPPF